ncbi:MAG: hypothetical protein LUQ41_00830 [Methanomicrobiales archaeon]|nr:hypothetical protein [Methanomicrobiales archaeon]
MKIPHCSTSATRRGVTVRELLDGLATSGFTGYCAIPFGENITSLVFEGGICLLAEHLGQQGFPGIQKLAVMGDARVDAALCDFTPTQLAVTLKLNDRCRVVMPSATPAAGAGKVIRGTSVTPVKIAGLGAKPVRVTSVRTKGVPAGRQAGGATAQARGKPTPGQILDRKIDRTEQPVTKSALESLKTLKDSFKTDAADLLEELNLGHLVVKGQPKNAGKEEEKR